MVVGDNDSAHVVSQFSDTTTILVYSYHRPQERQDVLILIIMKFLTTAIVLWNLLLLLAALSCGSVDAQKRKKKKKNGTPKFRNVLIRNTLSFDADGDPSISAGQEDGGPTGLIVRTLDGLRIIDPDDDDNGVARRQRRLEDASTTGTQILFGPTDDCSIGVENASEGGLFLRDPSGITVTDRDGNARPINFGKEGECRILPNPTRGLVFQDPKGVRIETMDFDELLIRSRHHRRRLEDAVVSTGAGALLTFGSTDDCRIRVDPMGLENRVTGIQIQDPDGLRLISKKTDADGSIRDDAGSLMFGPTDECRILVGPSERYFANGGQGMIIEDPVGVLFQNPRESGAANVIVDGTLTMQQQGTLSCARFKTNVRDLSVDALDKLLQMRGVYFDWIEEKGGMADLGFIAEEIKQIFPEAVLYKDGKVRAVKYANLVAVAVEAIKAQQNEIEQLKDAVKEQQAKQAAQEKRIDELIAQIQVLAEQVGASSTTD